VVRLINGDDDDDDDKHHRHTKVWWQFGRVVARSQSM